jgi:hypothetical protein
MFVGIVPSLKVAVNKAGVNWFSEKSVEARATAGVTARTSGAAMPPRPPQLTVSKDEITIIAASHFAFVWDCLMIRRASLIGVLWIVIWTYDAHH